MFVLAGETGFKPCYLEVLKVVKGKLHQPDEIRGSSFYAFSYYYDRAADTNLIGKLVWDNLLQMLQMHKMPSCNPHFWYLEFDRRDECSGCCLYLQLCSLLPRPPLLAHHHPRVRLDLELSCLQVYEDIFSPLSFQIMNREEFWK